MTRSMLGGIGATRYLLSVEARRSRACDLSIASLPNCSNRLIGGRLRRLSIGTEATPTTRRSRAGIIWLRSSMRNWPGSTVCGRWRPAQRQLPPSLSFGHGQARPYHPVGCERAPSGRDFCRELRAAGGGRRSADAAGGHGDGRVDRLEPGAAGRGVQMGDVERPHRA